VREHRGVGCLVLRSHCKQRAVMTYHPSNTKQQQHTQSPCTGHGAICRTRPCAVAAALCLLLRQTLDADGQVQAAWCRDGAPPLHSCSVITRIFLPPNAPPHPTQPTPHNPTTQHNNTTTRQPPRSGCPSPARWTTLWHPTDSMTPAVS